MQTYSLSYSNARTIMSIQTSFHATIRKNYSPLLTFQYFIPEWRVQKHHLKVIHRTWKTQNFSLFAFQPVSIVVNSHLKIISTNLDFVISTLHLLRKMKRKSGWKISLTVNISKVKRKKNLQLLWKILLWWCKRQLNMDLLMFSGISTCKFHFIATAGEDCVQKWNILYSLHKKRREDIF